MTWYALDDVGDAVDATRRFLTPFDRVRWLRLAVVMFFLGGSVASLNVPSVPGGGFDSPEPQPQPQPAPGQPSPGELTPEMTPELGALIVGLLGLVIGLWLAYSIASATMEFVFVESLRREEVRLKEFFLGNWRKGVRLFVFRTVVQLLALALFAGSVLAIGAALGGWPPTGWDANTAFGLLAIAVPALVVGAILFGNFLGFTTMFTVPVMVLEDRGVLSAWRRLWGTIRAHWKQYVVYAIVGFLLALGVGLVSGILGLLAAIVVGIPFLLVGLPVAFLVGLQNAVGGVVVLTLVVLYAVVMLVVGLLIQVPFQTFMRYHALLVLGDTNDGFDAVPDAREAVRSDGGDGSPPPGTDRSDDGPDGSGAGSVLDEDDPFGSDEPFGRGDDAVDEDGEDAFDADDSWDDGRNGRE